MQALAQYKPGFALRNALTELKTRMRRPVKPLRTLIIDDNELTATAMYHILKVWPNLTVEVIIQTKEVDILAPESIGKIAGFDIVFIDDVLDHLRGTDILDRLHERGVENYPWVIVSTCGSSDVPGFSSCFTRKEFLHSSFEEAAAFVKAMNGYVVEAEIGLSL